MQPANESISEATGEKAMRIHPDIFTSEEAAKYLRLTSVDMLANLREQYGLTPLSGVSKGYLYHRADLDQCVLRMFGKDAGWRKSGNQPLRLAK